MFVAGSGMFPDMSSYAKPNRLGPQYKSSIVYCDIRAEIDFYWFEEKFEKTRRSRVFLISEN